MPVIHFETEHLSVEVPSGRPLREIALENGINPNREIFRGVNCGGRGLCGTCQVWIQELVPNAVSASNLRERMHGLRQGRRLACQAKILGDARVTTMPGGCDRLQPNRPIDPAPNPVDDPSVPRKPVDEAGSIAYPLGHPSKVGRGNLAGSGAQPVDVPVPQSKASAPAVPTAAPDGGDESQATAVKATTS